MASISTEEDVVNVALSRVGNNKSISDLDTDTTAEAVALRRIYYNVRDRLIRSHSWNFLTKRAELSDSGSDPTFGWDEGFTLPSDYMRTVDVLATDSLAHRIPYKIEKQVLGTASAATDVLLCNSTTCFLIYIYKETDPSLWITDFQDAVAWAVAAELALSMQVSRSTYELCMKEAERAILKAKSIDGQEDWQEDFPPGTWLTDRWRTDEGTWQ